MADLPGGVHHDAPVVRETVVTDGGGAGSGFGAGMMLAALAILAAVIIGLALLFTQPWDDDDASGGTVPDVSDSVPDAPDAPSVPDVPDGGDDVPAPEGDGGGEQPAQ